MKKLLSILFSGLLFLNVHSQTTPVFTKLTVDQLFESDDRKTLTLFIKAELSEPVFLVSKVLTEKILFDNGQMFINKMWEDIRQEKLRTQHPESDMKYFNGNFNHDNIIYFPVTFQIGSNNKALSVNDISGKVKVSLQKGYALKDLVSITFAQGAEVQEGIKILEVKELTKGAKKIKQISIESTVIDPYFLFTDDKGKEIETDLIKKEGNTFTLKGIFPASGKVRVATALKEIEGVEIEIPFVLKDMGLALE